MKFHVKDRERVMTAVLTARPGKREELEQFLRSLLDQISTEAGCLQSVVAQCVNNNDVFIIYLDWADAKALAEHMASEAFRILLGASRFLSEPAQFRFVADDSPCSSEVTNRVRSQEGLQLTLTVLEAPIHPGEPAPGQPAGRS